jgi:DNA-binding LytR/AlgR family response regulator
MLSLVHMRKFAGALRTANELQQALAAKEDAVHELAAKYELLEQSVGAARGNPGESRRVALTVKIGNDIRVFPYSDILCAMARDRKSVILTPTGEHEVNRPLKDVEPLLAPETFLRVHRQCIVNVAHVTEVAHVGSGAYIALLRGRENLPLPVSRAAAGALRQRLGTSASIP